MNLGSHSRRETSKQIIRQYLALLLHHARYKEQGLWMDHEVSESRQGKENFLSSRTTKPALGPTYRPMQTVPGYFPGMKRQRLEDDHTPPSSVAVKNKWSYTPTPPIRLHILSTPLYAQ